MIKVIGWFLLGSSIVWSGLVELVGLEPTVNQIVTNVCMLLSGAILIHKSK